MWFNNFGAYTSQLAPSLQWSRCFVPVHAPIDACHMFSSSPRMPTTTCLPVSSDRQNVLSPPTSNFLKLNWGCTIINNKLIESNDLQARKRSILRTCVFVMRTTKIASSCFYWVKTGKYCARAAWMRTTSGGKTDGNIIQINNFCITKVFLPVASDRHQYFLPVTSWNYLKSTGRQATFRPL